MDKENSAESERVCKIESGCSATIDGLKLFMKEVTPHLLVQPEKDFQVTFNINAAPFVPKANAQPNFLNPTDLAQISSSKEIDPSEQKLLQKKQISKMYQYYNYLIFEKHKENLNDIDPSLRVLNKYYDKEVNRTVMVVNPKPETIRAAPGEKPAFKAEEPGKVVRYKRDKII